MNPITFNAVFDRAMSKTSCPSCGVPYTDHIGLNGTCALLREARSLLREWAAIHSEPCRYDAAGNCWIHDLGAKPCIVERTLAAMAPVQNGATP